MKSKYLLPFLLFSLNLSVNNEVSYALDVSKLVDGKYDHVSNKELLGIASDMVDAAISNGNSTWAKKAITEGNEFTSSINNLKKINREELLYYS